MDQLRIKDLEVYAYHGVFPAEKELGKLKGSEAHSTVMLTDEDKNVLRKLGINVTMDPVYQYDRLYRK